MMSDLGRIARAASAEDEEDAAAAAAEDVKEEGGDDVDELDDVLRADIVPADLRGLRACLFCSLVQSFDQFMRNGCTNCPFLSLEDDKEKIKDCTSSAFSGTIALMNPEQSWVARWQRTNVYVPGIYAVGVRGRLPEDIVDELHDRGLEYRPRDGLK